VKAPRTQAARRETTRTELLQLGLERFPEKGFSNTSIDDLLRGSGYSKGAFYFHFASKEQYFLELMRHRVRGRGEWWRIAERPELESLHAVLERVYRAFNDGPQTGEGAKWVTIIADFALTARRSGSASRELAELEDGWMRELTAFVEALQARGFARSDRLAGELAQTVQALMDGSNLLLAVWSRPPSGMLDALVRILEPREA